MKKIFILLMTVIMTFSLSACAKDIVSTRDYVPIDPEMEVKEDIEGFNFIEMHNSVLDTLMSMETPYFFIKENQFIIDGSNEEGKKNISITATCLNKTSKEDINLFLSDVIIIIGQIAAEQDFKYKAPEIDKKEGCYTSFGTVFNDYDLVLKITKENGDYLYNATIKAGTKIPIDPRYILAEGYYE